MTRSREILAYIEASSRWGAGMPARSAIARDLGLRPECVDSALETLAINGRLVRVRPPAGGAQRIAYELAPQRRPI